MMMTMIEKQDLGLSLSLNLFPTSNPHHLSSSSSSGGACIITSSMDGKSEAGPLFFRGIDVNRAEAEEDEAAALSSPNSTVSTVSGGKRSEREDGEDEDAETSRKKLRLSKDQSAILEDTFKDHNTLNPKQKLALAKQLGLRPRQVEVWFQNRRARTKLKQTEVDCEVLKRCCENLTEENRKLQREVQELRALKLSPHLYMQMTPPTTLTMCPSCERFAVPSDSATPAALGRHHSMAQAQNRPVLGPFSSAAPILQRSLDAFHH
ncbi:hypothetical protein PIB30_116704 [Stylosanthes scabra]|uniref:Homeobox domain-containing protein n=1 Tax=Stylosanthes scabra TaxID=79078 RepID=A0ABU6R4P4_9FABA|nr:hypothetical protein [Stylosanthes scabra]